MADPARAQQATLVAQAKDGDHAAFMRMVEAHRRPVWRVAWRFTGNREDAEDLVQETIIRAFQYFRKFRPDGDFKAWLLKIAVNTCLSHHRSRKRRPKRCGTDVEVASGPQADIGNPQTSLDRRVLRAQVRSALAALPPRQRAAVVLYDMEGLGTSEVAELMGCRPGTVKRHLHRARAMLCRRLSGVLDEVSPDVRRDQR
jgi:RNA polymerase sigma factor (sigma-70 family)